MASEIARKRNGAYSTQYIFCPDRVRGLFSPPTYTYINVYTYVSEDVRVKSRMKEKQETVVVVVAVDTVRRSKVTMLEKWMAESI